MEKQRFFVISFIFYLVILIIPLGFGSLTYIRMDRAVREKSHTATLSLLLQASQTIERRVNEVKSYMNQLVAYTPVKIFSSKQNSDEVGFFYDVWALKRDMVPFYTINDFTDFVLLYFGNNDIAFFNSSPFFFSELYEFYFNVNGVSLNRFKNEYLGVFRGRETFSVNQVNIFDVKGNYLFIGKSIPYGISETSQLNVLVGIDRTKIHKIFATTLVEKGGMLLIRDNHGQIIVQHSYAGFSIEQSTIDSAVEGAEKLTTTEIGEFSINRFVSDESGWSYITITPTASVLAELFFLRLLTLFATLISLIIGMVIAFLLSRLTARPLTKMLGLIESEFPYVEEICTNGKKQKYRLIKGFKTLALNIDKIGYEIEKQRPLLYAAFFSRLYSGDIKSEAHLQTLLSHIGLSISAANTYAVLVAASHSADIDDYETSLLEGQRLKAAIHHALKDSKSPSGHVFAVNESAISILLCFTSQNIPNCEKAVDAFASSFSGKINPQTKYFLCAGRIHRGLRNAHLSYSEAMNLLENKKIGLAKDILRYADMPIHKDSYYFPLELETKLISAVVSGNRGRFRELLEQVEAENIRIRTLSAAGVRNLIDELRGTLKKISSYQTNGYTKPDIDEQLKITMGLENALKNFRQLADSIITSHLLKKDVGIKFIDSVMSFLDQNYMDPSLSLHSIAEHFNLSISGLSSQFKNHAHQTVAGYLEQIRMGTAAEMLKTNHSSVEEIALRAGYTSAKSFRRAFSRFHGFPPSTLKKTAVFTLDKSGK